MVSLQGAPTGDRGAVRAGDLWERFHVAALEDSLTNHRLVADVVVPALVVLQVVDHVAVSNVDHLPGQLILVIFSLLGDCVSVFTWCNSWPVGR